MNKEYIENNNTNLDFYIKQQKGFELGNFIELTPTINILYDYYKKKIPVFFETPYLIELFKNWEKIKIIDEKEVISKKLLIDIPSFLTLKEPEYLQIINKILLNVKKELKDIYIRYYIPDNPCKQILPQNNDYVVIAKGCINHPKAYWAKHKDVGTKIYKYILSKINIPIYAVGNTADYDRDLKKIIEESKKEIITVLDDINSVVKLIRNCKYMIANDTGLYHVAGALNKEVFVIWKDTPLIKNKSFGKKCFYSLKGNWENDFDYWLNKILK